MKRWTRWLAAAAAAALLAGCATDTHEPADLVKIRNSASVETLWSTGVGESEGLFLTPAVMDNAIYAAGSRYVSRVDPSTGSTVWETKLPARVTAGVSSDGYTVAVGIETGEVVALDVEGHILWQERVAGGMEGTPLVGRGLVIVRSGDGHVFAYDALSGREAWGFQRSNPPLTLHVPTGLAFIGEWVVMGQANGRLLALDMNGGLAWQSVVSRPSGTSEIERMVDVVGLPIADDEVLCAAAFQGRVTCMNRRSGAALWSQKVSAIDGPTIVGDTLAVTDDHGFVWAWQANSGSLLWKNDKMQWRTISGAQVTDRAVVAGDSEGYVHFLDRYTGEFLARKSVSGAVVTTPTWMSDIGSVLVQTDSGKLYMMKLVE